MTPRVLRLSAICAAVFATGPAKTQAAEERVSCAKLTTTNDKNAETAADLALLKQGAEFSQAIHALATQGGIPLCLDDIPSYPVTKGYYMPSLDRLTLQRGAPPEERAVTLAHEIVHAAQFRLLDTDEFERKKTWDNGSMMTLNLLQEAAATAYSHAVLHELVSAGVIEKREPDFFVPDRAPLFARAFDQAYARSGDAFAARVEAAQELTLHLLFKDRAWRRGYFAQNARAFINDVKSGEQTDGGAPPADLMRHLETAGRIGKTDLLGNGFIARHSITAESLLHGTFEAWEAHTAIEIWRHRKTLGEDHPKTKELERKVAGNRLLTLDLDEALPPLSLKSNASFYREIEALISAGMGPKPQQSAKSEIKLQN